MRSDDTPIEANLESICRKNGVYRGSKVVEKQRSEGVYRKLVSLTLDAKIPVWGLEGVYCNGNAVGYLRRADFAHSINKSIGKAYIRSIDGKPINVAEIEKQSFQIDVIGELYGAKAHLESPEQ